MPLADAVRTAATQHPARTALIVEQDRWSFSEFDAVTDRVAARLMASGIAPGDRVALHFTNGFPIAAAYYACFKAGAIAVPLNTRMKRAELAYVLNHSGARLYLGHANLYAELHEGRSGLEQLADVFLTGDLSPFPSVRPLEQLTDPGGPIATADVTWPVINEDAPAVIMYTSGTTARPKGVTHTHRTLTQLAVTGIAVADVHLNDVSGIVLPTCHIFGLSVLVSTLIAGNTVVMIPRFELPFVLEQLQQHGVTIFGALPVMLNAMLHTPGAATYDLSRLRACFAGGDAVPTEVHRRFKETFRVDVTEACGMTEVQPYAVNPLYGRGKVGSIGLAAPETTLRLVDPFDRDVETGASGEVLVRSGAMMVGYWNDPAATAATIVDGWLRTGDLARLDEDGYYWFVGRTKEIIVRAGSNISPLEVEDALYQHPAVREVGVVGVPNAELGEVVRAFVALKSGATATSEELRAFVGERLAAYKVPESITFLPDLPKGLTGKVQRKALKEMDA